VSGDYVMSRRTKVKIGRNDPCPCRSGKKFKKCCLPRQDHPLAKRIMVSKNLPKFKPLKEAAPELQEKATQLILEKERKEKERIARFGQVRPQVSIVWQGQRWVTVRNRIYYAAAEKWKFFPDFLRDYVPEILGIEWCKAEAAKPEVERHPVITWRGQAGRYMNAQPPQPDGSRVALPSGAVAAFACLAYDLFVVDDNGGLDPELVERLKSHEHFQGARQELFAEATCYRAGFTIQHENEKDGRTRHAEFTAKHVATGQMFSVEAKSRHFEGVLGRAGKASEKPSFRIAHLINDAVAKKPAHPLLIFVDMNLPYKWAERILGRQAGKVPRPMQLLLDRIKKQHSGKDPYCMVVFSNHPHHYAIHNQDPQPHLFCVASQPPCVDNKILHSIVRAATLYGNIPQSFSAEDGDPPPPAAPLVWPRDRYDFLVNGTEVLVVHKGQPLPERFATTDKDRPQAPSRLHEFLEDGGLSRVDAHAICEAIESGKSVAGVFLPRSVIPK